METDVVRKFEVGDIVACVASFWWRGELTEGHLYEVTGTDADGWPVVIGDMGRLPPLLPRHFRLHTSAEDLRELCDIFGSPTTPPPSDPLNPPHYTRFKIQPLDFIRENNLDFLTGNVIKYVLRADAKNGREDLLKARRYLDEMLKGAA